jgi:hypothetical protein
MNLQKVILTSTARPQVVWCISKKRCIKRLLETKKIHAKFMKISKNPRKICVSPRLVVKSCVSQKCFDLIQNSISAKSALPYLVALL